MAKSENEDVPLGERRTVIADGKLTGALPGPVLYGPGNDAERH